MHICRALAHKQKAMRETVKHVFIAISVCLSWRARKWVGEEKLACRLPRQVRMSTTEEVIVCRDKL